MQNETNWCLKCFGTPVSNEFINSEIKNIDFKDISF